MPADADEPPGADRTLNASAAGAPRAAGVLRAAAVLVAAIVSFLIVYALCRSAGAQSGPAILAVVLAISLSRRPSPARVHGAAAYAVFVLVAPAAAGVAWLLHASIVAGAAVFVGAMSASVWLRSFGPRARALGAMLALPLLAILIVPVDVRAPGGRLVDLALVIAAGAIALTAVTLEQSLSARWGIFRDPAGGVAPPDRAERPGLSPSARMALQMAAALTAAFVTGLLVFPGHWAWTVLTAFIVCSGARGRGDALYKGVLRLLGALAGTLGAAAFAHASAPTGVTEAVLIFAALFAGVALRDVSYAYWAACMTLVLALLSRSGGGLNVGLRLEAILVGAVCGVAAAWFVTPIRTRDVIRRRLLDALAALDDLIADENADAAERARKLAVFNRRLRDVDAVAPPVAWHRRAVPGARTSDHPADWIELTRALSGDATKLAANGNLTARARGTLRRALGLARRGLAQRPGTSPDGEPISASLRSAHAAVLEATSAPPRTKTKAQ